MKQKIKNIALILSVLIISLMVGFVFADWQEPASSPPGGNVSVPINVGSTGQTKSGALTVQGDFTAPIFYDADNSSYYVNPAGNSLLGGDLSVTGTTTATGGITLGGEHRTSWPTSALTFVELAGGEDYTPTTASTWEDWDISGIVPVGTKYVLVHMSNTANNSWNYGARKNGSSLNRIVNLGPYSHANWTTEVDENRVIEIYGTRDPPTSNYFNILGYWK